MILAILEFLLSGLPDVAIEKLFEKCGLKKTGQKLVGKRKEKKEVK